MLSYYICLCSEDGTETSVSSSSESYAQSSCSSRCSSPGTNSFSALRLVAEGKYKCKCVDLTFSSVVLENKDSGDPMTELSCPEATEEFKTAFQGDSGLTSFLASNLSLTTNEGQLEDSQGRQNLCNPERLVDIVTLYLAQALGLDTADIKANFVYEKTKAYVYPDTSRSEIFPPDSNLTTFPGLEQTYWTIVSQFTASTEPGLRSGRSAQWCWVLGKGLHDHCSAARAGLSCSLNNCYNIWKYFIEACHRVRSLDPSLPQYRTCCNPNKPCASTSYPGVQLYQLRRM